MPLIYICAADAKQFMADSKKLPGLLASAASSDFDYIKAYINLHEDDTFGMLFLGDMMFDRGVRTTIAANGAEAIFTKTTRTLSEPFDLTIANLEGPITSSASKTIDANGKAIPGFTFTFATPTAPMLRDSGIDVVSLANNHADNFGEEGLRETVQLLKQNDVFHFGNARNAIDSPSSISTILCPEKSDHRYCIGLIGYHQFAGNGEEIIVSEIQKIRASGDADYIIVFPHWGNEYEKTPTSLQRSLAHTWIDAGADIVIGAHPHIVQSMEMYKEKPIFYSLGNYMFDQYFSYDTTHGLTIGLTLSHDNSANAQSHPNSQQNTRQQSDSMHSPLILDKISLMPIDITGTKVKIANEIDRNKMLAELAKISTAYTATSTRDQILMGEIMMR